MMIIKWVAIGLLMVAIISPVLGQQTAEDWFNKGVALDDQGNYADAIKAYDEAVKLDPNYAEAWYNNGNALYREGKYNESIKAFNEAIKAYDEAIKQDPNDADLWNNKGIDLKNQGKYDEAIKAFDEAIRLDLKDADAWNNKGIALSEQGKYVEAIEVFDDAIELNPQDARIQYSRSHLLMKLGRTAEADAASAKANELVAASPNTTYLRIGYQLTTHQMAEIVAGEGGWWAEDLKQFGVKEILEFEYPSGQSEIQAMYRGGLDIAYMGTAPIITAIAQGLDAKIVSAVNINGSNLVLRPDVNYSGAQSLGGLNIATLSPGSIQDLVLKMWLKDNGMDNSKVNITVMNPEDAVTAISAGKVDGVFLPHPSPAIIESRGKGKSVVASGEMWPNHACCSLLISGKLLREQPELVKQIIKTHTKATEYVNAHPKEAAQIFAKKTKQNHTVVETSIEDWDGKWVSDLAIQVPSTVEYAKIDMQLGYINETLSKDDLFDMSFYRDVVNPSG